MFVCMKMKMYDYKKCIPDSESDNEDEYVDWHIEWMVVLAVIIL